MTLSFELRSAPCAAAADPGLADLARGNFSSFSPAELALLRYVGSKPASGGDSAAAGPRSDTDDLTNDPAQGDEWGKEREVRAEVIRWLCVDLKLPVASILKNCGC